MSSSANPEYTSKILGPVTTEQYKSIGFFFENRHFDRLANKTWPSNLRSSTAFRGEKDPNKVLAEINPLLEDLALSHMFTRNSVSNFQHLPLPYGEAWVMFVSSVTQALGRSHLHQIGEIPLDAKIVTQTEMRRALAQYPEPKLDVLTREFTLQHKHKLIPYGIPDDLVMQSNVIGGVDVSQLVDYYPTPPTQTSTRAQLLKATLTNKESAKVLKGALGDILNLDPGLIYIPTGKPILTPSWGAKGKKFFHRKRKSGLYEIGQNPLPKVKMVVGSDNENGQDRSVDYDGDPIQIGLPNTEVFSLWLLRILAGNISREADWRQYFQKIG